MKKPATPLNEKDRLDTLFKYDVLDTVEENIFDDITALIAAICDVPIALVSLIDEKRQWFKSHYGIDVKETPREVAFCAHAINGTEIFVVENSAKDERFHDNPLVTNAPHVNFYAGAPLITPGGFIIGTLCVIDQKPRTLSPNQLNALEVLAKQVITLLELRRNQKLLKVAGHEMQAMRRSHAIIEFNLDGYILDANEKFQNLMGYSLDELIGNHHSMFIPYHLKESEEYSNFWKNILNGQFENGEFKRITKNEKEIWISGSYNPIYNESNQLIKIIKTAIDITKEKLQSEELRQSNLAILNSNLVIEFETDGRIIGANKKFLDLIGYSLEEITGKFYSFITPQDVKNYVDYLAFWDGFKNGNYQAGVFEILGKNNSLFYIRGTFNPILDSMGNPYKIITHAMDITTERIANIHTREIFQSIDRYAAYIEFDLAGNIIFANDGFLKTMKYSKAELQHKTHSIFLINSEVNSIEAENFWKDLTSGIFKSGDYLRINKFGKEVWIRGSYHPIFDKNGKPYKIIKYAIDITQHV